MTVEVITDRPQAQGDLIVLPWPVDVATQQRTQDVSLATPIGPSGALVLSGVGGHEHRLVPSTGVSWYAYPNAGQTLGVLAVQVGAVATLRHVEHGDSAIGAGVYVIRRQREQADEIRLVAD
jgi:hypothetical protein